MRAQQVTERHVTSISQCLVRLSYTCSQAFPRYSGSIISFRQVSRSRISALEQLGEHQGGAGG